MKVAPGSMVAVSSMTLTETLLLDYQLLYSDDRWQMYDVDTGLVTVINGTEGCEVAGDPNNSSGRDNFCLECTLESLGGGIEQSILIPVIPVPQGAAEDVGNSNVGIALNGVLLGPPAPIDLILSTFTLGVFDDCGGHINPNEGYHYHAVNGCSEVVAQDDGHAPMIGYAMDGYPIYGYLDEQGDASTNLDECGGTSDETRGYHYHAQPAGTNEIIGCYMGERIATNEGNGPPQRRGRPPHRRSSSVTRSSSLLDAFDLRFALAHTTFTSSPTPRQDKPGHLRP